MSMRTIKYKKNKRMKLFLKKILVISLIVIVFLEVFNRIFVDPLYFYKLNTFSKKYDDINSMREKIELIYTRKDLQKTDYLFIGTSRVPASINPNIFEKLDKNSTAIVAGRGYATAAILYQGLKKSIEQNPEYINNAKVIIEYPGSDVYIEDFKETQYDVYEPERVAGKPMPHLLIPYLDFNDLIQYMKISNNSTNVKIKMVLLYVSSTYRSVPFIKEYIKKLDTPLKSNSKNLMTSEGGIRNDNIEFAIENAKKYAEIHKLKMNTSDLLSFSQLNKSMLAQFNKLTVEHGGKLYLYKVPLHSIHANVYNSEKALKNKKLFENWLLENDITILKAEKFSYTDSDFPDVWHLSSELRDEFSKILYEEFGKMN